MSINIRRNEIKNFDLLWENYEGLSDIYSNIGNYKAAYTYLDSAYNYKDSLQRKDNLTKITNLEKKYQLKEKNTQIETLQKENAAQRKIKTQYGITAVAALISSLLLILFLHNRRKLHKKTLEAQQQQIAQLEQEKQVAALAYLLKGQEEERTRLARDLHDGLGGMLSGMKISLSQMEDNNPQERLHNVIDQLDSSIKELRHIAHNMMPEALLKYGLDEALNNFCTSLNHNKQINITYQSFGWQNKLDKEKEVVLYRIAQELINNAIKHAQANNILVQVICNDNSINLTVEDDGIGYQKDAIGGMGLKNIESRASFINATFEVQSKVGTGTTCQVEVILQEDKNYAKNI
jgi:two-component system, NarL family, sensor kinase